MIKVFVIDKRIDRKTDVIHRRIGFDYWRQTPNNAGRWGNLQLVKNPDDAELFILLDEALLNPGRIIPEEKAIYISRENFLSNQALKKFVHRIKDRRRVFLMEEDPEHVSPTIWMVGRGYDDLKDTPFPEKTKLLSAQISNMMVLPGHQLRVKLMYNLCRSGLVFDFWGMTKPAFRVNFTKFPQFQGELQEKWEGVAPYKYTIALGNVEQNNYMTEKLADAVLAGALPIYWECPNISDFLPKGSYYYLDIRNTQKAIDEIIEVINSDYREQNLSALYEAKDRILDRYQFWPVIHRAINKMIGNINGL